MLFNLLYICTKLQRKKKKKLIISHKSYDQQQSICPPTKHVQKSNVINNVFKVILFYLSFIYFFPIVWLFFNFLPFVRERERLF